VNQLLASFSSANELDVISIDIDSDRGPEIIGDVCTLPLPANAFDVVVLAEVLEHLHSPPDGLRNLHGTLKHGGKLILTVPFILPMHDRPHDYFRFTVHGLELLLRDFRDVHISARDSYYEAIDVLWVRLLQTNQRRNRFLSCFVIPMVFFIKRPITLVLGRFFATDAMTTGYVATAIK
jgi:SAM-dependent methyltransferase